MTVAFLLATPIIGGNAHFASRGDNALWPISFMESIQSRTADLSATSFLKALQFRCEHQFGIA